MAREAILLRRDQIGELLDMPSCIDRVEAALAAYSTGHAELPGVIHLDIPESSGEIHVKAGYLHGGDIYALKFASGFPGNTDQGLPASGGMVIAFDAGTGEPRALMFDDGLITDVRTGAAGGVAAKYLAPAEISTVAVIGTGVQARRQLDALACVRSFDLVRVWGRDEDHARACVHDLKRRPGLPSECSFTLAPSVKEAVEGADVVITCTASREPLVFGDWLSPSVHVTALGSDGPGKQELDAHTLGRADVVVVDSRPQCTERGELQHALAARVIADAVEAAELGEVIAGVRTGRTSPAQFTVCDLTGVGVQDVATAALVLERANERNVGEHVAL